MIVLCCLPQGAMKTATITSLEAGSMVAGIQVHPVQPGQKSVQGITQSLVNAQTVQVGHRVMVLDFPFHF